MAEKVISGRRYKVRRVFFCKASKEEFYAEDGFTGAPNSKVETPIACPEDGHPHLSHKGGDTMWVRDELEDLGPAEKSEEQRKTEAQEQRIADLEAKLAALTAAKPSSATKTS